MTATEPASLDALLRAATPVEAEPFDLGALIQHEHWCLTVAHGDCCGNGEEDCDCDAWKTRISVALMLNEARVDTERARALAVTLEQECAAKDARIAEALGYLTDALVWCNRDNTGDCISEAIAALIGDES